MTTRKITFKTVKDGIPQTGRIGRLAKHIEKEAGFTTAKKIIQHGTEFKDLSLAGKAAWMKKTVEDLEQEVGIHKARKIMEACGRLCCGATWRKRIQMATRSAKTLKDVVNCLNRIGFGGGRLTMKNNHTITGGYDFCYCRTVRKATEQFKNTTYCHCSVGWYKQLFETALGKPVHVKITQSIISGAKTCEFVIRI